MTSMATKVKKGIIYACLILLALICFLPFLLMMVNATRSGVEITHSFTLIPSNHLAENWTALFEYVNLFLGFDITCFTLSINILTYTKVKANWSIRRKRKSLQK